MRVIKAAMLGFGNAGQAFAKLILQKEEEIRTTLGCDVLITAIGTRSRGSLVNDNGINLFKACDEMEKNGYFEESNADYSHWGAMEIVEHGNYDVLIELTPLAVFSGQPAIDHITAAMNRKKHVITANKGPVAWAYRSLRQMADRQQVLFYHETTVMDGTPVFNLADETLKLCKIIEIKGILNSTTNFILEELAKGKAYKDVIAEGKQRGFVEADPSMDVEGWDAAAKTAALLNVLMGADLTPRDIERTGIEHITLQQIRDAEKRGNVIKLICRGKLENGNVVGMVAPEEISKHDLLASICGTSSIVAITTDLMGTISIVEHEPEIQQTGYGVFSDLLRIISNTGQDNRPRGCIC